MANTTEEIMKQMFETINTNYIEAIEANNDKFSEILSQLTTIELFSTYTKNIKIQDVMNEVFHDMVSSIYMSCNGMYRNAFVCLRSAIELSLSCVYFMDHNYEFMLWQLDEYDVKWSVLSNRETGVLSEKYLKLFIKEKDFNSIITKTEELYRMCSQYVHGKYLFMQTNLLKHPLQYNSDNFNQWYGYWLEEIKIISVIWTIRMHEDISSIDKIGKEKLKENMYDFNLGGMIE